MPRSSELTLVLEGLTQCSKSFKNGIIMMPRSLLCRSSNMSELADRGPQTELDLGRCLRHLYVHQLGFLPERISDPDMVFLRCSP